MRARVWASSVIAVGVLVTSVVIAGPIQTPKMTIAKVMTATSVTGRPPPHKRSSPTSHALEPGALASLKQQLAQSLPPQAPASLPAPLVFEWNHLMPSSGQVSGTLDLGYVTLWGSYGGGAYLASSGAVITLALSGFHKGETLLLDCEGEIQWVTLDVLTYASNTSTWTNWHHLAKLESDSGHLVFGFRAPDGDFHVEMKVGQLAPATWGYFTRCTLNSVT